MTAERKEKTMDYPTAIYQCPKCHGVDLAFDAVEIVTCYVDGVTGDVEDSKGCDQEWDDSSRARCVQCNWTGTVADTQANDDQTPSQRATLEAEGWKS